MAKLDNVSVSISRLDNVSCSTRQFLTNENISKDHLSAETRTSFSAVASAVKVETTEILINLAGHNFEDCLGTLATSTLGNKVVDSPNSFEREERYGGRGVLHRDARDHCPY
ncbi:hypothetical protein K0M31_001031 [Melipona bicolor]|uniref:Uncharacterized protein n=1 Tax=Melipona bicolor TaxID=60889 RepID=A0AA40GEP7_9HYME|nr:hypothetical protein K0M31_001031 [Melipona bicolor]